MATDSAPSADGARRRVALARAAPAGLLWIAVVTAGKTQAEALNPDLTLPSRWQLWENVAAVWEQGRLPSAFLGSLLIMVPAVLAVLTLGSLASWVLARRSGRAVAVLYALAISGIVLPPAVVTIVLLLRQLGLAGTAIGMIGAAKATTTPASQP